MASPQSTTSHEDSKKNLEQITFRFCAECSNMLYPKEDPDAHKLQFTCRTCQYTEEASSSCVFRNVLNNAAGETAGVTQDVGSDPTVGDAICATAAVDASASTPGHANSSVSPPSSCCTGSAVLCLCCGGIVACRSCGAQLIFRPAAPSSAASNASADSFDETRSCSTDLTDIDDMAFDDDGGVFDVCRLSDQFELENDIDFYMS